MLTFQEIALSVRPRRTEKDLPGIAKAYDYLAARGLDRGDVDRLGLLIMPAIELISMMRRSPNVDGSDGRLAIVFPHWSFPIRDAIEWWSARLVDTKPPGPRLVASFDDVVERKSFAKMLCPPLEPPHAYLPPILDWDKLPEGETIYIHESMIKSVNGAKLGKYSVGLNGVWGWGSKKHGIAMMPEILSLPWKAKKLNPVILFDSNITTWHVAEAASKLAERLYQITGRQARLLRLPKREDGEDQGFDDFRVSEGDAAALRFLESDPEEIDLDPITIGKIELNNEVCVVQSLGRIAVQATGTLMSRQTFADVNYAHRHALVEDKRVSIPREWLAWDQRAAVERLVFQPGRPRITAGDLNLWHGMGVEPLAGGDVEPWLTLLTNNVRDDWLCNYLLDWLAYPLQNLGAKLNSNLLVFGPAGTGKNLFFAPITRIYGDNGIIISNNELRSAFNSVYAQKQWVHADELTRCRDSDQADLCSQRIKMLITSPELVVNTKGVAEYRVDNHLNLVITSNYYDCVKLDEDDRRMCAVRWDPRDRAADHRGDQAYWRRYVAWLAGEGPAAVYAFLLDRDLRAFDPAAWAPETEWKATIKEGGRSSIEQWVLDLKSDPDSVLPPTMNVGLALWSSKALAAVYWAGEEVTKARSMALSHALRNAGMAQAAAGKQIKSAGVAERYWVVRAKGEDWTDLDRCIAHLKLHKIV